MKTTPSLAHVAMGSLGFRAYEPAPEPSVATVEFTVTAPKSSPRSLTHCCESIAATKPMQMYTPAGLRLKTI